MKEGSIKVVMGENQMELIGLLLIMCRKICILMCGNMMRVEYYYTNRFDNLGNGKPAKLFNSNIENAIWVHFKWMKEYRIDGASVQRFVGEINGMTLSSIVNCDQLYKIKEAAETNGRLFNIMYDISGGNQINGEEKGISSYVQFKEFDWVYKIEKTLILTESLLYATKDGKPVLCIWNLVLGKRPYRNEDYIELINFYRKRGC